MCEPLFKLLKKDSSNKWTQSLAFYKIKTRSDEYPCAMLVLPSQGPPFGMRNQCVNSMAQFETSGFRANEYLKYLKFNQSELSF